MMEKHMQEDALRHFSEWCFLVECERPKMASFALAAIRMYLEKWHAPEEIDVFMAQSKLNASRPSRGA